MATPHPPPPPALMEDAFEEILLRFPPDEPALLVRAALVCKPWHRILSDRGFLRRYRQFHRTPPVLGYVHNLSHRRIPRFVPTCTPSPIPRPSLGDRLALDCRHGRVLLVSPRSPEFIVWDPITGKQNHLGVEVPSYPHESRNGAVICAAAAAGCNHLDCHDGAFLVVSVVTDLECVTRANVYSSETGLWSMSNSTYIGSIDTDCEVRKEPSRLIGGALYFTLKTGEDILKFDLEGRSLSVIKMPNVYDGIVMATEDGGLGFVDARKDYIRLWSWQLGAGWEQYKVIELQQLVPGRDLLFSRVIGCDERTHTIFINTNTDTGVVTLDLKSMKLKRIADSKAYGAILPYTSFYTTDLAKGIPSPP